MADENESGRKAAAGGSRSNASRDGESGGEVLSDLKSVGIDTDRMAETASEQVSELQRLVLEEVRARPLRALAWATAAGVVLGFWAAK